MEVNQQKLHELERLCTQEQPPAAMAACPLHINCRDICRALAQEDFDKARTVYEKAAVFPELLSTLCEEPCRDSCARDACGGGLWLRVLEKAAVRFGNVKEKRVFLPGKTQRAAVVGAGIAGMAAALELGKKGYAVTVFEKEEKIWSALEENFGISEDMLKREQKRLEKYPITINTGQEVTDLEGLAAEYDAVVIAWGIQNTVLNVNKNDFQLGETNRFSCGDAIRTSTGRFVDAVAEGRRTAISADRFLKRVSMDAGREQEGVYTTSLHVNIAQEENFRSKLAGSEQEISRDAAVREAGRCLDCKCTDCTNACAFMRYYKGYPKKYLREIYNNLSIAMGTRHANKMINSCSLCGQCKEVCPHGLDLGAVIREARQIMVEKEKMPQSAFEFALNDMKYSNSEQVFLARAQEDEESAYVFFPGCQLPASAPGAVEKAYAHLRERLNGGVGLILGCCGVMADWAGEKKQYTEAIEKIQRAWEKMGKPIVIAACPMCLRVLSEEISGVECRGIWEVLLEIGLPSSYRGQQGTLMMHDSCGARNDLKVQEQVRQLARAMGYELREGTYRGEQTACCGYGGLTQISNPEVADLMTEQCLTDGAEFYLTYCINCRERFRKGGAVAVHILELIYDTEDAYKRAYPGYSMRWDNRLLLRRAVLERFWNEKTVDEVRMELQYDDQVKQMLEERKILDSDIRAVLARAQEGYSVRDQKSGWSVAHRQVGNVTFWVYYHETQNGAYVIGKAYAHRMTISNEGEG
ncbi:4Fe-4S dicluster domain-containing protein [Ruminococcus sp. OA3]|uniref:pyridine nucleotide-disulfide oxidoreductase/dicluster-binding protein n=1 Tax=Ruminococcus sp. OA3 TaxID=2914164 RepID=UPI001F0612B9|nr:pyridine nucleotide-disulfide oxidoreductase/dicluster-binding protein [Ruminococcus sp. OA3]MCH1982572.1 4Fe-4S dicluster domain-containing protein [Ruminococcus sp. OA3]